MGSFLGEDSLEISHKPLNVDADKPPIVWPLCSVSFLTPTQNDKLSSYMVMDNQQKTGVYLQEP